MHTIPQQSSSPVDVGHLLARCTWYEPNASLGEVGFGLLRLRQATLPVHDEFLHGSVHTYPNLIESIN